MKTAWLGVLVLLAAAAGGVAQTERATAAGTPPEGQMTFVFDWPAQSPPHYEITVAPDGTGAYRSSVLGSGETRPILLSPAAMARLEPVRAALRSGKPCETGQKKLAQTGAKTLALEQAGKALTCTYNYSEDKRVQEATATFQAIAATMEEAPKLEHLHRFDRLGLDAELAVFVQSVRDGRAIEVGNIAATLRSLAADNDLMERVRSRAADLLQHTVSTPET